jgi:ADP-ribose pyrophosphatase YjhB (NUDIX family)
MAKRVKHSVSVAVLRDGRVLSVRRSDDDDELPGIWGLPAGTCREGELATQLIRRVGREKLGVELLPVRLLRRGTQARAAYILEMELWEVRMTGDPVMGEWKWAPIDVLRPGADSGSLCCRLALEVWGGPGKPPG